MPTKQQTAEQLVDEYYALDRQIEVLKDAKEDLKNKLTSQLLHEGKEVAYGSDGIGYKVSTTNRYDFQSGVYTYLEEKGLLNHFHVDPKVTKTGLDSLLKKGLLTYADMAKIEEHTVQSPEYTIRKVTLKEGN